MGDKKQRKFSNIFGTLYIVKAWETFRIRNEKMAKSKFTIFRKEVASASYRFSTLVELEFGDIGFHGERKTRESREKLLEQGKNQQQTQPTYGTRPESNPGHIGGRRVLPPLPHPCSPKRRIYYFSPDNESK